MQIADVQDIFPVSADSIKLLTLAVAKEKPDLAVFTGDQIYGLDPRIRIGNTRKNVERVITAYLAPLENAGIPFCVTFGNHDSQCGIPNNEQTAIYARSPFYVEGERFTESDTGTTRLPIFNDDGTEHVFDLFLFDSGGQSVTGEYFPVTEEQLSGFEKARENEEKDDGKVPFIVFQHIPVPEFFDVLKKVPRGTKGAVEAFRTHKNEFYVLPDEILKKGGFMYESPAAPDKNSGEFDTLERDGGCLAIIVGHDHINSFAADKNGIKLIYTQCAGFNVYGPKRQRGVRVIDLSTDNLKSFETHTVTFDELCSDRLQKPLTEFVLTHIPTSMEQVKRIAAFAAAGAAAVGAAGILFVKKSKKRK